MSKLRVVWSAAIYRRFSFIKAVTVNRKHEWAQSTNGKRR